MFSFKRWLQSLDVPKSRAARKAAGAYRRSRWPANRTRPQVSALEERIVFSTRIWTGLGADANWATPGNWAGGVAPQADDNLVFAAGAAGKSNTNDFAAGTRFR